MFKWFWTIFSLGFFNDTKERKCFSKIIFNEVLQGLLRVIMKYLEFLWEVILI